MKTLSMRQAGETVFFAAGATTCVAIMSDTVLIFAKKEVSLVWSAIMIASLYLLFFWLFVPERGSEG